MLSRHFIAALFFAFAFQAIAQHPNHRQRVAEPLAVSSKRSPLIFSEIMYHPATRVDGRNLEFIELYNTNPWPEDLTGWRISDDVDYAFPNGTTIPAQGFLVVAAVPSDVQTVYGITGVLGPFTGALSNEGGTLKLRRANDAIVLEANWNDGPDWPAAADGAGHSLVLERPSYGEGDPRAWQASSLIGGTPGSANPVPATSLHYIRINEILAHSTVGTDFIELFNSSPSSVDISGCWISDDEDLLNKFQIPASTILPARGRISFSQTQLGFALSAEGETLYLTNPARIAVIDTVRYRGQLADTGYGRFPDGEGGFRRLTSATSGAANSSPARGPVVINEIYFNPISNDSEDEWLELRNLTASPVSLAGWRLSDGVSFDFPAGTIIAANGYLVVAKNTARILANHPALSPSLVVGPFTGNLANGGEELVLGSPVTISTVNGPLTHYAAVDEIAYLDKSRWSKWADGGGSSLELADARDISTPLWLDSNETAKAPWTLVEVTGVLDHTNLNTNAIANRIDACLLKAGQALVDEIEAIPSGGSNIVTNGGFESGIGSWLAQGNHNTSVIENSGFAGTQSLRMTTTGRGDTLPNRVRSTLTATISNGSTATIRARARWQRGSSDFLLRLRGGGLEAYGALTVPTNLGTPGALNSRAVANAPPAITDVIHGPVLPAASVSFKVFARVQDPDGLSSVQLKYRLDPSSTLATLTMLDNGASGDLLAGDGIYTGTIPGQTSGTLVGFTVTATDSAAASAVFPPTGECLVRVGDTLPTGAFGAYSMWITSSTLTAWTNRLAKTNEDFPITFLHNTSRVFYNTAAHNAQFSDSGSNNPTTPNTFFGYSITLPAGEPLLGEDEVTLDYPIRDTTNQREQLMHWMLEQMKLPTHHRRDVHLMVNGSRRFSGTVHIYHDCHQPGGEHVDSNFPDDNNGRLIKTSRWDEYSNTNGVLVGDFNSLLPFTTTGGVYKTARYRWCWMPRSSKGSENDFTDIFNLVTATNVAGSGDAYINAVNSVVDVDHWMGNFAFADLCAYWDTFGNPNDKNAYLYKPTLSGWKVLSNDLDIGIGQDNSVHHPSNEPLFASGIDPPVQKMFDTPALVRPYWRALHDSLNTFFSGSAVTTRLTQRYNGYLNNGGGLSIPVVSPFVASDYYSVSRGGLPAITGGIPEWINLRVAYVQSQLDTVASTFSVSGSTTRSTTTSPITITGTAPVSVKTITFNGLELPLTWTSVTSWSASVPVVGGTNPLVISAFNSAGAQVGTTTLTVTFSGANAWAALRINEWLADNAGVNLDPADGDSEDWFELYNPTASSVSLSGWSLSDNGATFLIPSGYSIPANGRLLVWADDEPAQNTGSGQLHVNYKLSASGDSITLRAPDNTVIDAVTFGTQVKNISRGRVPDGGSTIDYLASPSPGTVNGAALAKPSATIAPSVTSGMVTITVSTKPGFSYQLQYVNDLSVPPYTNIGTPVVATGSTLTFEQAIIPGGRRFFRVARTP
ncbi:MAG: lamin tail domain-containing protein [Verrucomicrobiales bacterium]